LSRHSKPFSGNFIWGYHEETRSEARLAQVLRKAGIRFRQEVPVREFTVDFLIDDWLVVEVDGESHLTAKRMKNDAYRQKKIEDSGFTVLRVSASSLGTASGRKSALARIKKVLSLGPPYKRVQSHPNEDLVRQVREIEKALRIGEIEKKKRESLAFDKSSSREHKSYESMEDYFGTKEEDFGKLLEGYDWSRTPQKDTLVQESSLNRRSKKKPKRRR
jgi:very-short-patch-repair endonuclease